jgi:hypothetical protein
LSSFDEESVRKLAAALFTNEGYIEKDWHLVRALAIMASITVPGVKAAFSGGTSLSSAWQLIHRFSEDIDFKVTLEGASKKDRDNSRRAYRNEVIKHLTGAGFVIDGEPIIGNASRFFRVSFHYGPKFPDAGGIRPGLQVEISFTGTALEPQLRPVQSLLGRALKGAPEIASLPCVDPAETAADKVSALAWRTASRKRGADGDDPAVVRHLHDLAALGASAERDPRFKPLVLEILDKEAKRSKKSGMTGRDLLGAMLPTIKSDELWRREYEQFVGAVSFGRDDERISFDRAMEAAEKLVAIILG